MLAERIDGLGEAARADRRDGRGRRRAADPRACSPRSTAVAERRAVAPAVAAARASACVRDVGLARRRHDRAVSRSRARGGARRSSPASAARATTARSRSRCRARAPPSSSRATGTAPATSSTRPAHARRAGDEARAKLDFDLSARWYAIALEGTQWTDAERRELRTQLADALADAGRPREAADQFLRRGRRRRRRDRARAAPPRRRIAAAVGLRHRGPRADARRARRRRARDGEARRCAALLSMLRAARVAAHPRPRLPPRSLAEISQAELTRVDVCEGVSFGLALVDTFRSMDFGTRFLLSALRLGEPGACRARSRSRPTSSRRPRRTSARSRLLERLERADRRRSTSRQAESQLMTTRGVRRLLRPQPVPPRARRRSPRRSRSYRAVVGRAGLRARHRDACSAAGRSTTWARSASCRGACRRWPRPRCATATATPRSRCAARSRSRGSRGSSPMRSRPSSTPRSARGRSADGSYQLQHLFALCSRIDLALYRGRPEDVDARGSPPSGSRCGAR